MAPDRHTSRASFACTRCKKDKRRCDISQISSQPGRPDQSCTPCRNKKEKCEVRHGEDKRSHRRPSESKALHQRMRALEEFVRNAAGRDGHIAGGLGTEDFLDSLTQTAGKTSREDARHQARCAFPSPASSSGSTAHGRTPSAFHQEVNAWSSTPRAEPTPTSPRSLSFSSENIPEYDMMHQSFPPVFEEAIPEETDVDDYNYLSFDDLFPYSRPLDVVQQPDAVGRSDASCSADTEPEPEPIVAHLLHLFWEWQSAHLLAVDRRLFTSHRKSWDENGGVGDRDFYSPSLLYAMLSLASMTSPDKGVVRYSAPIGGTPGDKFARKARALLEVEVESPTITTVQTALVLGCRYGAVTGSSLGAVYNGIALRLARTLGLHQDCSKLVSSGKMHVELAELRKRVFWACHFQDNLLSAYSGHPTSFLEWDITVSVPDPPDMALGGGSEELSTALSHATFTLTQRELRQEVGELDRALRHWYASLPEVLTWSREKGTSNKPETLVLQMTFFYVVMLLHRPFAQLSHDPATLQSTASIDSSSIAKSAAESHTRLALEYSRSYNIRQAPPSIIHSVFLAGTTHLASFHSSVDTSQQKLVQCCRDLLAAMKSSYSIAEKACVALDEFTDARDRPDQYIPPMSEVDALLRMGKDDAHRPGSSTPEASDALGHLDMGASSNECALFGHGMPWLSDTQLFDAINSNDFLMS
ncbi:putative transcriptional regulatory protein [Colletotrichum spinosum]|uniref:Putative transcriptional regulatory protein n=1 Tax=Colletotrichum spinosum TaxID=1347390 RepID=A0A4R8Q7C2_9PEZI|nr:putative transcriptional regulatory protein [Colletotrichum spinosum]